MKKLDLIETQIAIKLIKDYFERELAKVKFDKGFCSIICET